MTSKTGGRSVCLSMPRVHV